MFGEFSHFVSRTAPRLAAIVVIVASLHASSFAQSTTQRDVLLEVYYTSGDSHGELYLAQAKEFQGKRKGVHVVPRDLNGNTSNADRLKKIVAHFQLKDNSGPLIYGCNRVIQDAADEQAIQAKLRDALRFEVFVREGCSRCEAAEEILPSFLARYPAFELSYRVVNRDTAAVNEMNALVRKYKASAASTPVLHFCGSLQIGFDRSSSTTDRLRKSLERWTVDAPKVAPSDNKVSEVTVPDPF